MKYLIYFAVTTPLLLAWLFWQTAGLPPPPPMFHSFAATAHDRATLEYYAKDELLAGAAHKPVAVAAHGTPALPRKAAALADAALDAPHERAAPAHFERTARALSAADRNIRLR